MASSKSYDAFSSVDKLVAKPVVGSDGAASWQDFRKESKLSDKPSVAPSIPMKRADRLGTGMKSMAEEREHENRIRQQAGEVKVGEGYTVFKRKSDAEEAAERKKRKRIEERIRPDEKDYFIPSTSFTGWKFDYIYTRRDGKLGYFWDGMDSVKKLHGLLESSPEEETKNEVSGEKVKKKKKKKKKASSVGPVIVDDPNNPLEQVANAIRRRNEALLAPPASLTGMPADWEKTTDQSSGKVYYFNRKTGERQWESPSAGTARDAPSQEAETPLPAGWSSAKDPHTGKEYFYHTTGETRWDRPSL